MKKALTDAAGVARLLEFFVGLHEVGVDVAPVVGPFLPIVPQLPLQHTPLLDLHRKHLLFLEFLHVTLFFE